MAAMIKPIEAKSVHQIQSAQVIVDLCSVVKELVENALDADANVIEVRFKNYGLDAIEVQDNGTGISEANYESLALKHYTSKLSTYDDLLSLQTFGFRGEALSSLCALSSFSVLTAQAHEAPKGMRLDFETSGKLKTANVAAAQKGTTVIVENLFAKLPVRQKELIKNIKREYGKVVGLLQSYACISTNVKLTVKNNTPKTRSAVVFATNGNSSTRDNIANVYGAKMLSQLIELDLKLEFQSTLTQTKRNNDDCAKVGVVGHISKPVFGEGRQTPDRQLFFVNGRPCGLPQIQKAINEVYKSFNVSQSAFVCANFRMDTSNYDVNVSPDKRTILLHDAVVLTDRLKEELTKRFDDIEQTVPQSQVSSKKLPSFRQLTVSREPSRDEGSPGRDSPAPPNGACLSVICLSDGDDDDDSRPEIQSSGQFGSSPENLLKSHFGDITSTRQDETFLKKVPDFDKVKKATERQAKKIAEAVKKQKKSQPDVDEYDDVGELLRSPGSPPSRKQDMPINIHVQDFNARMREQDKDMPSNMPDEVGVEVSEPLSLAQLPAQQRQPNPSGITTDAFSRMRPLRASPEIATITIGDRTITRMIGTPKTDSTGKSDNNKPEKKAMSQFGQTLRRFGVGDEDVKHSEQVVASEDSDSEAEMQERNQGQSASTNVLRDMSTSRVLHRADIEEGQDHLVDLERACVEVDRRDIVETADRTQEEYRVAELIRLAETTKYVNNKERQKRTNQALKGGGTGDSTASMVGILNVNLTDLLHAAAELRYQKDERETAQKASAMVGLTGRNEEERLSLTISKSDFSKMHIAGQFNLGFIIALRHKDKSDLARQKDELFIIDQHASDEKYNFERLQAITVVGNQRLVHPVMLDLTAVEEEIVLENDDALQQNGFIVEADTSGSHAVGQRCKLLSLPLSKEVTFNTKDLEELIHLLSESHISPDSAYVPRPSKVRKMFAMRACRSSIMIGRTLSKQQMRSILNHMGRIDKPWNCPHGRPTMRHLTSLDDLDGQLWEEGDGLVSEEEAHLYPSNAKVWQDYAA